MTAYCPWCMRTVRLRADYRTFVRHTRRSPSGMECKGSGRRTDEVGDD